MRKILILYLILVFSASVIAESAPVIVKKDSLQSTIEDISAELESINEEITKAYLSQPRDLMAPGNNNAIPEIQAYQSFFKSSNLKGLYDEAMKKVYSLKKQYADNPYISISGFSINIGAFFPSVTISFEFKNK